MNKCECGFEFAGPGEFRNCEAFVTKEGQGGVIDMERKKEAPGSVQGAGGERDKSDELAEQGVRRYAEGGGAEESEGRGEDPGHRRPAEETLGQKDEPFLE